MLALETERDTEHGMATMFQTELYNQTPNKPTNRLNRFGFSVFGFDVPTPSCMYGCRISVQHRKASPTLPHLVPSRLVASSDDAPRMVLMLLRSNKTRVVPRPLLSTSSRMSPLQLASTMGSGRQRFSPFYGMFLTSSGASPLWLASTTRFGRRWLFPFYGRFETRRTLASSAKGTPSRWPRR